MIALPISCSHCKIALTAQKSIVVIAAADNLFAAFVIFHNVFPGAHDHEHTRGSGECPHTRTKSD